MSWLAGAEQRGQPSLVFGELVLAFGLWGVKHAVVKGAQVQVGGLVGEQGFFGALVGELSAQPGVGVERGDDLVETGVEPGGSGTDRDALALAAAAQQIDEFAGGGLLQLGVELLGSDGVHLGVCLGGAVGHRPARSVLELQAERDLRVGFTAGKLRHGVTSPRTSTRRRPGRSGR